jgi:hypothetical protein
MPPVVSAEDSQELHVVVEGGVHVPSTHESPLRQGLLQAPQSVSDVSRFWHPSAQLVSEPQFWVVP